jgi:hypothetical protein
MPADIYTKAGADAHFVADTPEGRQAIAESSEVIGAIAEVAEPLAIEAAEVSPAKGTAPTVSVRANLSTFHLMQPQRENSPLMAGSIPRINVNTVTGISGAVSHALRADNTGVARWSGPIAVQTATSGGVADCIIPRDLRSPFTQGTAGIVWEFVTDAPNFCLDGAYGSSALLILRDGELITEGAITVSGGRYLRILTYEYTGFHHYQVFGGPGTSLANIVTGPNDTIYQSAERKPLVGFLTDSYGSFGTIAGTKTLGLVGRICQTFGWRPRISIEGGSGYQTNGTGPVANTKFSDRISAFNGLGLDAMVILGSRNDPTAGLAAAATSVVQAFMTDNPTVPVIMGGPWAPSESWESGSQGGNFAIIEDVADALGAIYVDTRGIITGDGDITANPGVAGNGSRMVKGAHPTEPSAASTTDYADGDEYHALAFIRRALPKMGAHA